VLRLDDVLLKTAGALEANELGCGWLGRWKPTCTTNITIYGFRGISHIWVWKVSS
jgi:hypothetical protein